jgi:hypothetical protein
MAGYFGPPLSNHQHTTSPGDGSQLLNPTFAGQVNVTAEPATNLQLATTEWAALMALLMGV